MHHFRSNPPSRAIKPRPAMTPAMRLLREVEAHLEETGTSPSTFGRQIIGSSRLVPSLREGGMPTPATIERIRAALTGEANHA